MVNISVIIPNYNHSKYLKQRIDSVLHQSYTDFELILLDDASTDYSVDILNTYRKHPKVSQLIINTENSGSVFKQWIKGIELAQGNYIWIAESDDFSDPDFLKLTVNYLEQDEMLGLIFTDSFNVNESGEIIELASKSNKCLANFKELECYKISDRSQVPKYFISDLVIWNASSVLFRKKAILDVDFKILASLKNAGDLFTYISIALKYDVLYLNKPLNYYRLHQGNTTSKNLKSGNLYRDRQTIVLYFIKELQKLKDSKTYLKLFFRRNFLTAVDFKLHDKVAKLLKAYCYFKILNTSTCLKLNLYINMSRIFGKAPHKYRQHVKKIMDK